MGGFDAAWLTLREPADAAARSERLTRLVGEVLRGPAVLRALDLATGTGANVRYLAERLPLQQEWLMVDDDATLVAEASARTAGRSVVRGVVRAVVRRVDLATELESAGIFSGRALVTASALLDLVSERWLRALVAKCRDAGAAVLFALSYDGEIRCTPHEPEDEDVRHLVNQHQRGDKGFGPALGPAATDAAEHCLTDLGYQVEREPSPWVLAPDTRELQRRLIEGWAEAAAAVAPQMSSSINGWRTRRLAHIAEGRSRIVVGHEDLAAWLPNFR